MPYLDSIDKTMDILGNLILEPLDYHGKHWDPPTQVTVSPAFFRTFHCNLGCGGCCRAWTLDYLPDEAFAFHDEALLSTCTKRDIQVNGQAYPVWTIPPGKGQKMRGIPTCQHLNLETGGCGIYHDRPLTCALAPVATRQYHGVTHILRTPFSRGWNMERTNGGKGALCTFEPIAISEAFKADYYAYDRPNLWRLKAWADYFHLKTHLDAALDTIGHLVEGHTEVPLLVYAQ